MLILAIFAPVVVVLMRLMFWSFTVANSVVGEIRLSRDIVLMVICFVLWDQGL